MADSQALASLGCMGSPAEPSAAPRQQLEQNWPRPPPSCPELGLSLGPGAAQSPEKHSSHFCCCHTGPFQTRERWSGWGRGRRYGKALLWGGHWTGFAGTSVGHEWGSSVGGAPPLRENLQGCPCPCCTFEWDAWCVAPPPRGGVAVALQWLGPVGRARHGAERVQGRRAAAALAPGPGPRGDGASVPRFVRT